MGIIAQLITSFIASAGFSFIFNAPRKMIVYCGLVGMLGWLTYLGCISMSFDVVPATLAASFIVTMVSQLFSRLYKSPIIVFSVSGIIPLVPGGIAYDAVRNAIENNYDLAISLTGEAIIIAGAIAIGLGLSEVINQIVRRIRRVS